MSLRVNNGILDIEPYKGGDSKIEGVRKVVKLSSNESPLGPSPLAVSAYQEAVDGLSRYPDGSAVGLRKELGRVYGVDAERIVCGAGSDEIIALLCRAYVGAGDEVLYTEHGFLMYAIAAKLVGAVPIAVVEKDLRTNVEALLAAVTGKTRIVFIANPNNPTGSYISGEELLQLRQGLRDDILLVIDGAYAEYVSDDSYSAGFDVVDVDENTVVTRTFSKIYGLASLRVGWAYCPAVVVDVLNRVRGPFNVSSPAMAAAIAAVGDEKFTKRAVEYNEKWRGYLSDEITGLGFRVYPSVANFVLVSFPGGEKQANEVYESLLNKGIIVRRVVNYGLPDCLRITVGLEEDNRAVVDCLKGFLN